MSIEINEYLWEGLYALKAVYDHDPDAAVLKMYQGDVMDGDYVFEIAVNTFDAFFADSRNYYDEEKYYDIHVFFDPLITKTWTLCEEYERRHGIRPEENLIRKELMRGLHSALYIDSYAYDYYIYSDTKRKNGCRIVLLMDVYFELHCMVPGALSEAYATFRFYAHQLEDALKSMQCTMETAAEQTEKEAA